MRRVAACVVTGFLGSGKTTLLKGLLEREPGRERIAVIVNELGETGIDGRVLGGFDFVENVVELASGCVCCSIDEYRFDLAVDELVRRLDPALLVLETTGVADPAPAVERLRRCGIGVDAVVTVVDATGWQLAWRLSSAARRQIAAADFLVISKGDLAGPAAVARLRAQLAKRNPRALILEASPDGKFAGAGLLLATSAARAAAEARRPEQALRPEDARSSEIAERSPSAASTHLEEDGIEAFSWTSDIAPDRERFERALAELPAEVLRAKGFLRARGEKLAWLFHLVCGRVDMTAVEAGTAIPEGVQAVFLGQGIRGRREKILAALHLNGSGTFI